MLANIRLALTFVKRSSLLVRDHLWLKKFFIKLRPCLVALAHRVVVIVVVVVVGVVGVVLVLL